jgi:long-chain fatty acid adenylase/transferase FadD26
MSVSESFIPGLLRELADRQPDKPGFTFIDYELDPSGFTESLTFSQMHRRVQVIAAEIASCGSPGDRVAIMAPQGLDYIAGFLGAMQAGFIAVPLPVPQYGAHDERVSGALRDCAPVAILTTSVAVGDVVVCVQAQSGRRAPAVIEIDALDLDSAPPAGANTRGHSAVALLQYTSGSTRAPAGVVVTHNNVFANLDQLMHDYLGERGKDAAPDTTVVSWLPFYHDMGLLLGVFAPLFAGWPTVVMSPTSFLVKPARWMQQLGRNICALSAAPNFAFELAVRRTSDHDMAGLDLGDMLGIINGSERIHPATIRRFTERFARFNLPDTAVWPSYGLAEATLYVASSPTWRPPVAVRFDYEKLSAGHAKRCESDGGSEYVSYGPARACTLRIVDPQTRIENPAGRVGEIWIHGDNVAGGYWRNPQASEHTFGGRLLQPSPGTPQGPWLRTGDLGVMSDGELFIVGRIKDLVVVDGRNHYPDDIEATIQEITGGRAAAISVPDDRSERLVAIVEMKKRGGSAQETEQILRSVKREVTSAITRAHSLRVADLVLVPPGSIPITTSGKIRRAACAERYRQDDFSRLDATA